MKEGVGFSEGVKLGVYVSERAVGVALVAVSCDDSSRAERLHHTHPTCATDCLPRLCCAPPPPFLSHIIT